MSPLLQRPLLVALVLSIFLVVAPSASAQPTVTFDPAVGPVSYQLDPAAATTSMTATFAFSSPEPATFECALGSAPRQPCNSPYTVTAVQGLNQLAVFATDSTGMSSAYRSWVVDAVGPYLSLTVLPDGAHKVNDGGAAMSNSASVSTGASDGDGAKPVTLTCTLDGVARGCGTTEGFVLNGLALGMHVFVLTGTDWLGNVSTASFSWKVIPLRGTNKADSLRAWRTGGTIHALAGADTVHGANGPDIIYGEAGDDVIFSMGGKDALYGGAGSDTLEGGRGKDTYVGGPGNDKLRALDGIAETVNCGPGNDMAYVDATDRVIGCELLRYSNM